MRLIYLHQYFNTPAMPGSTRSYEMARRLVAMGHQVEMITSWREEDGRGDWFVTQEAGFRVHWLPVPYANRMNFYARLRAFLRFAAGAARRAAALPADIVLATSTPLTIALPGVYAAWRQKIPMVFEVRDLWPEMPIAVGALSNPALRWAAYRLEHWAYHHAERVVALSPGMRDGVVKTGYPAERITVIPNSADLELFDPAGVDPRERQALRPAGEESILAVYTGTLGRLNGVEYLVRLAAEARKAAPELRFAIYGDGQEEPQIRRLARELGVLDDNLRLYPPLPKSQMPTVLAAADLALSLFVDLEPMWANSANKFFDALAAGRPVAINYGGWQAELLAATGAGLVLPPNDPAEAVRQLRDFTADREKLQAAGRAARRLATEKFDRNRLAAQLEEVLCAAARHHR